MHDINTPMPDEAPLDVVRLPEPICIHHMKFDHAAHYGCFDVYKCTDCGHVELIYWKG